MADHVQVANIFTEVLGKKVGFEALTAEEAVQRYVALGVPEGWAKFLAYAEIGIKNGDEDRLSDDVLDVTGRSPKKFRDFVKENKAFWL